MDELDLLWMDLRGGFDQIPEDCFELQHLWLRVMLDVEMARSATNQSRWPLPFDASSIH
jgi:hypothetical protein